MGRSGLDKMNVCAHNVRMTARERVTLTLDPEILARIDAVARARDEPRTAVAERILRNGISDEERLLETIGEGVEGRILAYLLQHPKALNALAKAIGEDLGDEQRAILKAKGPSMIDAGRRYRSYKKASGKGGEE